MKTYQASGNKHISSNGFVNYMSCTPDSIARTLSELYKDLGEVVVLDGDDDWFGQAINKPIRIAREAKIGILGYFHTGVSGMSCTGIIIDRNDYPEFLEMRSKMLTIPENTKGTSFKDGITAYNANGVFAKLT